MRALLHISIPVLIIGLGVWGFVGTQKLKEAGVKLNDQVSGKPAHLPRPAKQRKIHTRATPLVKQDYTIQLKTQGILRAHNATTLTAQVSGQISEISPQFEDGAFFNKNDILLKIDTADYRTELANVKARLAKAEAAFAQEEASAKQALLNWKDTGLKGKPSDLVLRKPQLHDALANVVAARAAVEQAQRNLERTNIRAPYKGRVRKRSVGLGQQVGASTQLGEIFSTSFAEVRLPLSAHDLTFYTPPNKPNSQTPPSPVIFTSNLSENFPAHTNSTHQWHGTILRTEGELDPASRQLFLIARIDDPFGLKSKQPSLFIGQPVRATIPAQTLKDVYVIPRKSLSDVNEIIVVRNQKIKRVKITPIWSESDLLIIRDAIQPGDLLSTTHLPYAPEGASVEILPDKPATLPIKSKNKRKGRGHGIHK
jgi:RND family efflux transporter MFP subunit